MVGSRVALLSPGVRMAAIVAAIMLLGGLVNGCAPLVGGGGHSGSGQAPTPTGLAAAATPDIQGQLARAVYLNLWGLGVQQLDTSYDAQHATVKVTITLGGTTPNTDVKASAANALTKAFCLMALQAVWTSGAPLDKATVFIMGPLHNEYADTIVDAYGVAIVQAGTAQRIAWATISAEDAWQNYDQVFLRGSFELVD